MLPYPVLRQNVVLPGSEAPFLYKTAPLRNIGLPGLGKSMKVLRVSSTITSIQMRVWCCAYLHPGASTEVVLLVSSHQYKHYTLRVSAYVHARTEVRARLYQVMFIDISASPIAQKLMLYGFWSTLAFPGKS